MAVNIVPIKSPLTPCGEGTKTANKHIKNILNESKK